MAEKPIVYFGTPSATRTVSADYAASLSASVGYLAERGIKSIVSLVTGYDVGSQRDMLADNFLSSGATHLQFVDSESGYRLWPR